MLEAIIEDSVARVEASNQPMFSATERYDELRKKRDDAVQEWKLLPSDEKRKFKDLTTYLDTKEIPNLKDPDLQPARNLSLITEEIRARIDSQNNLRLLPIEGIDFDDSMLELAESLENVPDIRDLYKLRKKTVGQSENAGINAEEALRLKNCFSQGRELYLAGKNGSLMVKPLNFFYALTAYAYGIIVLNNPLRFNKGNLPGSHGLAYLPDAIKVVFGGDTARGTFSDLVTAFPTQLIKSTNLEVHLDCTSSLMAFYKNRFSVSLGTLLSTIPEMSEYYKLDASINAARKPIELSVSPFDPL